MASRIVATGRATPRNSVSNTDLERRMDTSDEWVRTRTGIVRRYVICTGESLIDIAAEASRMALNRAGMKASDLDVIVVERFRLIMASPPSPASSSMCLGLILFRPLT